MKDIQTQQQMQRSGMYQKKRRREKKEKLADLLRKGGKAVERVIDFFCMAILILFILSFAIGTLFFIGMVIYFRSELNQEEYTIYSEQQRMEDEIQMQELKKDAERRAAKKREKEERRKRKKLMKQKSRRKISKQ